jgi:hypothetical protein
MDTMMTELLARSERSMLDRERARASLGAHVAELRRLHGRSAGSAVRRLIHTAVHGRVRWRWLAYAFVLVLLAACGGGGDSGDDRDAMSGPTPTTRPTTGSPRTAAPAASSAAPATEAAVVTTEAPAPSSSGTPATAVGSEAWQDAVTTACTQEGAALVALDDPAPDADASAYHAFVDAVRTVLADGAPISEIDGIPPDLADALAEREAGVDSALAVVDRAAAGDLTAARQGVDRYRFHLSGIAILAGEAGATCGPAEPARVNGASINAWLDFPPITVSAGFGSIWIAENDGHRAARLDAISGEPIATIDVGDGPVIGQPADGRMWMRTDADIVGIDPQTNTVAARLPKSDVGPTATRFHALDGALWICDGPRLHRYDPTTLTRLATIELGVHCGNVTATADLVVVFPFRDETPPVAAFVDPATNMVVGQTELPAPVFFATVQPDTVFFAGWESAQAAVVDRATWTLTSTPDLGRPTVGGTLATDGTSIYVPAADSREVLVIDAVTFTIVDTIEPIDPWSVAVDGDGLWIVEDGGPVAQRFDR